MSEISTWGVVIAFIAVINALGVVRLLTALSEMLRFRHSKLINHYWLYYLVAVFQFLIHVLFWWSIVGLRELAQVNFLYYLYLLIGPTLLFLGSSLLVAEAGEEGSDLRELYLNTRNDYYSILILFWIWVILIWPIFVGEFVQTVPVLIAFLVGALLLRFTRSLRAHGLLVVLNFVVYALLVSFYALIPQHPGV